MARAALPFIVTGALIAAAVGFLVAEDRDTSGRSVEFEEVDASTSGISWDFCVFQSAHAEEPSLFQDGTFFVVIRDISDWQRVWGYAQARGEEASASHCDLIGDLPTLDADFESEMVIAVMEQYPSGGHSLVIDDVVTSDDALIVEATRTVPGRGCLTTASFEYEHKFIKLARMDLPVEVSVDEVEHDCQVGCGRVFVSLEHNVSIGRLEEIVADLGLSGEVLGSGGTFEWRSHYSVVVPVGEEREWADRLEQYTDVRGTSACAIGSYD